MGRPVRPPSPPLLQLEAGFPQAYLRARRNDIVEYDLAQTELGPRALNIRHPPLGTPTDAAASAPKMGDSP